MLLKKNYQGKMLIEQIIEFKLRDLRPLDRVHVFLQLIIFMSKQK